MRKKVFVMFLMTLFLMPIVFADRNTATVTAYKTSTLVKRGNATLYSVTFTATANGGDFIIYDAITQTVDSTDLSEIQTEGSEVTALGTQHQDFSDKPLTFRDGIYLLVNDGYAILRYE